MRSFASLISRFTSPRQHAPEEFLISQAQLPAFTSAVIRAAIVQLPVCSSSRSMSALLNAKQ